MFIQTSWLQTRAGTWQTVKQPDDFYDEIKLKRKWSDEDENEWDEGARDEERKKWW